jgi:hypothetical protein
VDPIRFITIPRVEAQERPPPPAEEGPKADPPPRRGALACQAFVRTARRVKAEGRMQYHKALALV